MWQRLLKIRAKHNIYGGGTPTTLEPDQLERLLSKIENSFNLSFLQEWTVEAGRPDSITREKLKTIKRHPVTRISINPQTMKDEITRTDWPKTYSFAGKGCLFACKRRRL